MLEMLILKKFVLESTIFENVDLENANICATPGSDVQEEENRQNQLAIAKRRQVHTNTSKLLLRIKGEGVKDPKSAARWEVFGLLKGYGKVTWLIQYVRT